MKPTIQTDSYELWLGDCRDVLPHLAKIDLLLTDPPYGIGMHGGANEGGTDATGRWLRKPKQYKGSWDNERPSQADFVSLLGSADEAIIWGGNYFADLLPQSGRWLFWNKRNSMPTYSDGEMAWTSLKGDSVKMFTQCSSGPASIDTDGRHHPTQKPVALMGWCIGLASDPAVILDTHMGVGSTGRACVKMGRYFVGIERDPGYFQIARERLEATTGTFTAREFGGLFAETEEVQQ